MYELAKKDYTNVNNSRYLLQVNNQRENAVMHHT